jgi:glycosyltransferase involved in cell wall biosynthesis
VPTAAIVSYRLAGADGVSIEAAKWAWALGELGFEVRLIAGAPGPGVIEVGGLGIEPGGAVDRAGLDAALEGAALVVVENLCSLPLNPAAGEAVAAALAGRPAVLRHHDLAWHRSDTARFGPPPDDEAWRHVTINRRSALELAERGIDATVLYNRFDVAPPLGSRAATRAAMGIGADELVVLQPTRALARKNVPGGLALAEALGATYWLTAAAEDGFGPQLERLVGAADVRVLRGPGPGSVHDLYAAADAVVLPSTWEGFGNPTIESVAHLRPLALGDYPVADEIRSFGFEFFSVGDPAPLARFLEAPRAELLERNLAVARAHFDLRDLPGELSALLGPLLGELAVGDR